MASSACNTVTFTAWALPQPDETALHLRHYESRRHRGAERLRQPAVVEASGLAAPWFTRLAVQGVTAKVMAARDFLLDSQVQAWLDGLESAWTLLTFESLQALRHEPAATRTAIRIANELSCDEIAPLTHSTQYPDPSSGGDCPWRPAVDRNRQPDQGGGGRNVHAYGIAGL